MKNKKTKKMSNENVPEPLSLEFKVVYSQDNDCMDEDQVNGQFLDIKIENGGGGDFYVMSTNRWAFEKIEDLVQILQQFIEKHNKIRIDNN